MHCQIAFLVGRSEAIPTKVIDMIKVDDKIFKKQHFGVGCGVSGLRGLEMEALESVVRVSWSPCYAMSPLVNHATSQSLIHENLDNQVRKMLQSLQHSLQSPIVART